MKHTPGPWEVKQVCPVSYSIVDTEQRIIADIPQYTGIDNNLSNAYVMAAAPEQHQMLIDLLLITDSSGDLQDLLESVRTLVAEVEGTD